MALSVPYPGIEPPLQRQCHRDARTCSNAWIERVHRAGIQVNCHANGDVAIDLVLTAVERAQQLVPAAGRAPEDHPLHADQRRAGRADQGRSAPCRRRSRTYAYYNSDKFHFYGEEMMQRMPWPIRTFLDAGVPAAPARTSTRARSRR